ncbi:MAG TPA: apolipoprotein N-acyltransferase [Treponemataceae bacterium]|nr:apolipoprotein N-acyltransferase [Treponemataceae bacterium]
MRRDERVPLARVPVARSATRNASLLILSVFLVSLSHPNAVFSRGIPPVAYVSLAPLLLLARRARLRWTPLWGGAYGLLLCAAFTPWLIQFHPLAFPVMGTVHLLQFAWLFPLLALASRLSPRYAYLAQTALWVGGEYVRTLGFVGLSYGGMGYTQWSIGPLVASASLFGVWGVSLLVVFPSALIATIVDEAWPRERPTEGRTSPSFGARACSCARAKSLSAVLWVVAFAFAIGYGFVVPRLDAAGQDRARTLRVALIQNDADPWRGGLASYRENFESLVRLTDEAIASDPSIQLVVWPETSFVPRIDWHYRYREDSGAFSLVRDLLEYLDRMPVPVLLGNDDAVRVSGPDGEESRLDYNAALLFNPGKGVVPPEPARYRKVRLVPFTEHFPYRRALPWVYDALVANDTHFWEPGPGFVPLEAAGVTIATPICFEDSFGSISRGFARAGAEAIVNLSNDAWSRSLSCQYQHLSMAVFRAAENRVPMARATASGQTCSVDRFGRVLSMAEPFQETFLVAELELAAGPAPAGPRTLYGLWGDLPAIILGALGLAILAAGMLTKRRHSTTIA